ncbi:transmembrane protein 45B-like [Lineus longissimus]|uniref:transmembrane protein 45B-like n=1 Tax=Lineus longissimus TaxID=88925 RepID=UPI002B4EC1BC
MGSFGGHALPGSFFIIFGMWWTLQISVRYYRARYRKGPAYRSTATFLCSCLCGRLATWQIEGFLKIFFTTVGLTGEIITGFNDKGEFQNIGNGQHATMFFIFGLSGLVDILLHHKVSLPKNFDYIVSLIAFAIEGILFNFHLHGRQPMDIQLHILLVYTIVANVITILTELRWPRNVLCAYARAYFVILQGTWFWQVGFILYNPTPGAVKWDEDDHEQMMITTIMFGWHMILILVSMMITSLVIGCIVRRGAPPGVEKDDEVALAQLIKKDANGQTFVCLNEESDSDMEYERPLQNGSQN